MLTPGLKMLADELSGELNGKRFKSLACPDDYFFLFAFEGISSNLFVSAKRLCPAVFLVPEIQKGTRREDDLSSMFRDALYPAHGKFRQTHSLLKPGAERGGPFQRTLERLLKSARLLRIRQEGKDRIVRFTFQTDDATGLAPPVCELVVELFPNAPDFLILDGDKGEILASLRKTKGRGDKRKEPGTVYEPPGERRSAETEHASVEKPAAPGAGKHPGVPHPVSYAFLRQFITALDKLKLEGTRRDVSSSIRPKIASLEKTIARVESELDEAKRIDVFKKWGELLLNNADRGGRGKTSLRLKDYYSPGLEEIEIPLNAKLTVKENALLLFKKARKLERSLAVLPERVASLKKERDGLVKLLDRIDKTASAEDLQEVRGELKGEKREKLPAADKKADRQARGERFSPRTFPLPGGWTVLVGRNSKENDYLTHVIAKKNDTWLHASQTEGSHVVLRGGGTENPPNSVIAAAAAIAAYYSKARKSGTVLVAYTLKKYVRKARKGKPGLAIVSHEKLIGVRPGLPAALPDPDGVKPAAPAIKPGSSRGSSRKG